MKCTDCKDNGTPKGCIVCGVIKEKKIQTIQFKYKEPDKKKCKTFWQEQAKVICEEFNIKGRFKVMIFQKAKTDMPTLKSNVDYCRGRGINNGRYLISTFRK